MPTIDYLHDGTEHEYEASFYTQYVYEQEFKLDLVKDVFGRIDTRQGATVFDEKGNVVVMDYTMDNWNAELRAFWAMLKTSVDIARADGRNVKPMPSFVKWCLETSARINHLQAEGNTEVGVDMSEISHAVFVECNRGLFRSGAAASA